MKYTRFQSRDFTIIWTKIHTRFLRRSSIDPGIIVALRRKLSRDIDGPADERDRSGLPIILALLPRQIFIDLEL